MFQRMLMIKGKNQLELVEEAMGKDGTLFCCTRKYNVLCVKGKSPGHLVTISAKGDTPSGARDAAEVQAWAELIKMEVGL